jgi:hypothetical protein
MATGIERWTALCNALVNGPATVAQRTRLANALAHRYGNPGKYAGMTNEEKAKEAMSWVRAMMVDIVHGHDVDTSRSVVDGEFPQAP